PVHRTSPVGVSGSGVVSSSGTVVVVVVVDPTVVVVVVCTVVVVVRTVVVVVVGSVLAPSRSVEHCGWPGFRSHTCDGGAASAVADRTIKMDATRPMARVFMTSPCEASPL